MIRYFPTAAIFLTASMYLALGIWLAAAPTALLTTFGINQSTPQMLTEIRAFYGGVELAIALAMLLLWRRGDSFAAALVGALTLACAMCGRLLGQLIDGSSALHLGIAITEAIGAALCFAACWQTASPNDDECDGSLK